MTEKARFTTPISAELTSNITLLLVAIAWGTSYGLAKESLSFIPIFGFLALRFGLAFMMTLPLVWRELIGCTPAKFGVAFFLGCLLFMIFCAETYGILKLEASLAAVLISLCIIFTPFLERVWLNTPITRAVYIALTVCVIGVFLICTKELVHWQLNVGVVFILLAALLRTITAVATKALFNRYPISPLAVTSIQFFCVALGSVVAIIFVYDIGSINLPSSFRFWSILLYLVVCCTLLAFVGTNYGIKHTSATRAALLMGMEPIFGLLFAVVWLSESLTALQWFGSVLVILSTYIALKKPTKNAHLFSQMKQRKTETLPSNSYFPN